MPEGRMVSKSISHNEQLAAVSLAADLLFGRCIPHLDSAGRIVGNPELVRALVVPLRPEYTADTVAQCLTELAGAFGPDGDPLVRWYDVGGRRTLEFPGFSKHQKGLNVKREAATRLPPPPADYSGVTPDLSRTNVGVGPQKLSKVEVKLSEDSFPTGKEKGAVAPTPAEPPSEHPAGTNGAGAGTALALVAKESSYVSVQTTSRNEPKTLTVVEHRLAEIQAAVTAQRGKILHEQQLTRYKIGVAFAYWAKITGHVRSALDAAAESLIRQALKLARADAVGDLGFVCYAIDGVLKSDWHQGRGPKGGDKHDRLVNILRDRQTAEELAERIRGYRDGQPHPTAAAYMAALESGEGVAHAS